MSNALQEPGALRKTAHITLQIADIVRSISKHPSV